MKKFLRTLFFVVPYPTAILWHLILGGFVAFLLVLLLCGSATASTYSTGFIGGGAALVAGLLVWLFAHDEPAA